MMPDGSWIKIENREYILNHFKPLIYHPYDPEYQKFWQKMRKRIIEGCWVEQFGKSRYVPGRLGFFGVFFRFIDWTDEGERVENVQPEVRDLEWHRCYYSLEANGFSGFSRDNKYTSDKLIFEVKKDHTNINLSNNRYLNLFDDKGQFKEFIPPRENLFMLHDEEDLGRPLYYNSAKNHLELGSRGGGKSYDKSEEGLYHIVTNSAKSYIPGEGVETQAYIEICSAGGGKAEELVDKIVYGMDAFANPENEELGVIEVADPKSGKLKVNPIPFYRLMKGSTKSGNKNNPWRNVYDEQRGENDWKEEGFGDLVYITSHSANQKDAAQKSAGGRRTIVIYEEVGTYNPGLLLDAWGNNEGLVSEAGNKQASQFGIGTSGNLETIRDAQQIFNNPDAYRCLSFEYVPGEKTCWFLPVYMVDRRFKDENGNTDVEKAKAFHENEIKTMMDEGRPSDVILNHKMNAPIEIEDMWIIAGGKTMPVEEAKLKRNKLLKNNLYKTLSQTLDLYWDSTQDHGVGYNINTQLEPFYRFPFTGRKNLEGAFEMFIHPDKLRINGSIPEDAIFTLVDPYVADEWDKGGSLGAAYWIVNPKYIPQGLPGYKIAAKYVGKPRAGSKRFCEIVCMGYAFYGNGKGTVWYEANRKNDLFRSIFIRHNRLAGLCNRPQFVQGNHLFLKKSTQTGYLVGTNKDALWTGLADILKQEITLTIDNEEVTCLVIELLDDLFLIEQIIEADNDVNVDAVSSLQGLPLAIGENEQINKINKNNLGNLAGLRKFTSELAKYSKYIQQ